MEANNPKCFFEKMFGLPVLLVGSDEVSKALKKNGDDFSLINLLEPFSRVKTPDGNKIQILMDSSSSRSSDSVISIRHVQIKWQLLSFFGSYSKFRFTLEDSDDIQHFPEVFDLNSAVNFKKNYSILNTKQKTDFRSCITPWFDDYRTYCFKNLGSCAYESLEYPIACVFFVSASEPLPFDYLKDMKGIFNSFDNVLPLYINSDNLLHFYVLVNDQSDNVSSDNLNQMLTKMHALYSDNCSLITINSSPSLCYSSCWGIKSLMSEMDFVSVNNMIHSLIFGLMIPSMEKFLKSLYPEVQKESSGIIRRLGFFWGSKSSRKSETMESDGMLFDKDSLEYQERKFADWNFILGNYSLAQKIYTFLSNIYKNESSTSLVAYNYRGSALEMSGYCSYLINEHHSGSQIAEIAKLFDEAFNCYMNCTNYLWYRRSVLGYAYWAQYRNDPCSISIFSKLLDGGICGPIEKALITQQIAISHLLLRTPQIRCYAFNMTRAADIFFEKARFVHALSSYLAVHKFYETCKWFSIKNYIDFKVVKASKILNRFDLVIQFFSNLLYNDVQPMEDQSSHLREFLYIIKSNEAIERPPQSLVPTIIKKVRIVVQDEVSPSDEWTSLETGLCEVMIPSSRKYLWHQKKVDQSKNKIVVVGESFFVKTHFFNKLKIYVQCTKMRVECKFENSTDGYTSCEYDKLFAPNELATNLFAVRPLKDGILTISRIRFYLCDEVDVVLDFPKSLHVRVIPPMPRLNIEFDHWPNHPVYSGEIWDTKLRISNTGQQPLKNLGFSTNMPQQIYSPVFRDINVFSYAWISRIPLERPLGFEESLNIEFYLRPNKEGKNKFLFLFYYEVVSTDNLQQSMNFRYKRVTMDLEVLKSLKLIGSVHSDPCDIEKYVLALKILNITNPFARVDVSSISISSKRWKFKLLNSKNKEKGEIDRECECEIVDDNKKNEVLSQESRDSADGQDGEDDNVIIQSSLLSYQSITLFFSIENISNNERFKVFNILSPSQTLPNEDGDSDQSRCHSDIAFEFLNLESTVPPLVPLSWTTRAKRFDCRNKEEIEEENRINSVIKNNSIKLFICCKLVYRDLSSFSSHNLFDISWLPKFPWYGDDSDCPLKVHLEFPSTVYRSIERDGVICVPVKFCLVNVSPFTPIGWTFEAQRPSVNNSRKKTSAYTWMGVTKRSYLCMNPGQMHNFSLQACLPFYGKYNLSNFSFLVYPLNAKSKKCELKIDTQYIIGVFKKD